MFRVIMMNESIPDFSADATIGSFRLQDYRGKNLVLYFYPKDNTPGCTMEAIGFRDAYANFLKANTEVVGISRDRLKSHENFSKKLDLPFPLIADSEEILCHQFGVIKDKKRYGRVYRGIERSTFLINAKGELVHEWRNVKVDGHIDEVLLTISNLKLHP